MDEQPEYVESLRGAIAVLGRKIGEFNEKLGRKIDDFNEKLGRKIDDLNEKLETLGEDLHRFDNALTEVSTKIETFIQRFVGRDAGNLSVRDRYGKHDHIRLLHCQACKSRFSEREGTPLSHSSLPAEKAISVIEHPVEGNSVRKTERLVGVQCETVMRPAQGRRARQGRHDELVAFSPETRDRCGCCGSGPTRAPGKSGPPRWRPDWPITCGHSRNG